MSNKLLENLRNFTYIFIGNRTNIIGNRNESKFINPLLFCVIPILLCHKITEIRSKNQFISISRGFKSIVYITK